MKRLPAGICGSAVVLFCSLAGCGSGDGPVDPNEDVICSTGFPCSREPVAVVGGFSFLSISAGGEHTCALEVAGEAYCWGSNRNGQLGDGSQVTFRSTPVEVAGGRIFVKISAGALHTCALTAQGATFCWGNGDSGALGTGLVTEICGTAECSRTPVQAIGGHQFASVDAGYNHTCAITSANAAYCWGSNSHGELGTGTYYTGSSIPEPVSGGHQFTAVSAGLDYTCALATDHKAWCWGSGATDALGRIPEESCPSGTMGIRCASAPISVETSITFSQVSAGDLHACGLAVDGYPYCWGDNTYGQIGVSGAPRGPVPLQLSVDGGSKLTRLSAAEEHSCALTLSSVPFCWGRNTSGEIGNGSTEIIIRSPTSVTGTRTYASISAGGSSISSHTCALTADGKAYCWGSKELGQLGDGKE